MMVNLKTRFGLRGPTPRGKKSPKPWGIAVLEGGEYLNPRIRIPLSKHVDAPNIKFLPPQMNLNTYLQDMISNTNSSNYGSMMSNQRGQIRPGHQSKKIEPV
jgi:hypothetical protein